jgi:AraC family transcriptional regulator
MPQPTTVPTLSPQRALAHAVTLTLHKDPKGVAEFPAFENALLGIHIGPAARLDCRRDGKRFSGTAVHGDIDIIPPHTPSHWEMHDQNDAALVVGVPQTLLRTVAQEAGFDPARLELHNRFQIRDSELEALGWAMKLEMELRYPSGRLYMDGLALAMASRMIARHSSFANASCARSRGLTGHLLKRVLLFIEDQLAEELTLARIAGVAGISSSHLSALFRLSMRMSVRQYVIQRRIERAKALLLHDGLLMADVAAAAGFAHQSHLARHMRRAAGVSPRAMRRLLAEAQSSVAG